MPTPPRFLPALLTPFTRSGDLDLEAHQSNLEVLTALGVRGFVIGGSNGEGPYLEAGERRALLEAARSTLGRRTYLMCGVMAEAFRGAERQITEAVEGGADSVLVLTPTTLARGRHDVVAGFFEAIADRSPLPVFLYTVPAVSGYSLPTELVAELSIHPNVAGIKDSAGDPIRIQRIVGSTPGDILVYNGASRSIALAMAAGAHGAITGSGNYAPALAMAVVERARRSPAGAMEDQRRLDAVSAVVEAHGVPGVKAAARTVGVDGGHPRRPLVALPRRRAEALVDLVRSI
jgi:dihydrodipicolinate synthase/N-acetylneuraminate lyase